ncbi:MAG: peptidoglycan DD-metalloendopeptidase family protein [Prevotellaceae bacterium]|nr:peptidoglycan DD-metalloendopeptidase family protein [Prevotellaceae bacterium]
MKHRFVILLLFLWATSALAQNAAKNAVKNLEQQKTQLEKDIAYTSELINRTQSEQKANLDNLNLIQANLATRKSYIEEIDKQLTAISVEVVAKQKIIATLHDDLTRLKDNYAKMLRFAYRNRTPYLQLMFILSSDDFDQAYWRITYLKAYSTHRINQADNISRQSEALKSELSALMVKKTEHQYLLNQKTIELLALDAEEKDYQATLYALQTKEKELRRDLEAKKKQAAQLNEQIQAAIAEEAHREAERRRKIEQKNKEMAAKFIADEHALTLKFEKQHGTLPSPVARSIVVTHFGVYEHPVLKGIKVTSNGIDLSTTEGAVVSVVADGVVRRIFTTGSVTSVLIQHGLYYTVYTHLKGISVRVGDAVRAKQPIGLVASAPNSPRAILHFELWKQTAKQDPEDWLSKRI